MIRHLPVHFLRPALLLLLPFALVAFWLARPGRALRRRATRARTSFAPSRIRGARAGGDSSPRCAGSGPRSGRRARPAKHRASQRPGAGFGRRHHARHRRQRLDAGARHGRSAGAEPVSRSTRPRRSSAVRAGTARTTASGSSPSRESPSSRARSRSTTTGSSRTSTRLDAGSAERRHGDWLGHRRRVRRLDAQGAKSKILIVLTDGQNNAGKIQPSRRRGSREGARREDLRHRRRLDGRSARPGHRRPRAPAARRRARRRRRSRA